MRVMIVDDEPGARRTLREFCAAHADLEVIGEIGDGRTAAERIRAEPPDLLFLDIQMDTMSGLEVARTLDPETMPMVVFVTAYDCYALDAFEVNAIDYLLKPFDEERFARTLERVRRRQASVGSDRARGLGDVLTLLERHIHERRPELRARLLAESHGRMHVVETERIELVEADRNYVALRVGRDTFHTRSTMQQAEDSLASQPMLKVSRSCLVNMRHVREVSRTPRGDFILVTTGGTTVTSSEGFRARVHDYLRNLKIGEA